MKGIIFVVVVLVIGFCVAKIVISNKINGKITETIVQKTGLGDKLNEENRAMNEKAIAKLDEMYKNGEVSQAQYEKRRKRLEDAMKIDLNKNA